MKQHFDTSFKIASRGKMYRKGSPAIKAEKENFQTVIKIKKPAKRTPMDVCVCFGMAVEEMSWAVCLLV